jgi:hypothetical protein
MSKTVVSLPPLDIRWPDEARVLWAIALLQIKMAERAIDEFRASQQIVNCERPPRPPNVASNPL